MKYLYPIIGSIIIGSLGFGSYKIYNYAYNTGYSKSETLWIKKYSTLKSDFEDFKVELSKKTIAEYERQTKINQEAKLEEQEAIKQIESLREQRDDLIKRLINEAKNDPNADSIVLGPSVVQRINEARKLGTSN